MPCALPTRRTSSSAVTASRSATVCTPARRSRSAVAGPTPGITLTLIGRSRSRSVPGGTTTRPSGLSRSEAILAMNFEEPRPTDAVSPPVASATRARRSWANAVTVSTSRSGSPATARSTKASSSESGSTSGEAPRRMPITMPLASR